MDPENDLIDLAPEGEVEPLDKPETIEEKPPEKPEEKPPVAAEKKDEPKKEEKPAPKARDDRVPLATFLQEKGKFTKAIEERDTAIADLKARLAKLENPEKPAPKYEEDPKGFIEHATKAAAKDVLAKLEETNKGISEVKDASKANADQKAEERFFNDLDATEQEFIAQQPDYYEALGHIREIAYRQLMEFNPELTHEQVVDAIKRQELQMAVQVMRTGRNPHEAAYRLAVINGYKKVEKKEEDKKDEKKVDAPKIEEEKRGDPSLSLGNSGGGAADDAKDDIGDPLEDALKEMFGRKRA